MCLPRVKVNINLNEDTVYEYFTSSIKYSRKELSEPNAPSPSPSPPPPSYRREHRRRRRQRRLSYDFLDDGLPPLPPDLLHRSEDEEYPPLDRGRSLRREQPINNIRRRSLAREAAIPRRIKHQEDIRARAPRQPLPSRVIYNPIPNPNRSPDRARSPSLRLDLDSEGRLEEGRKRLGRYIKNVEQRVIAERLVEVFEIAPNWGEGEGRREGRRRGGNGDRGRGSEEGIRYIVREPRRKRDGVW
ncbi:hypothetical protein FQN54_003395 [Arachnomyces sp. PD_36]|nr:hypothetical protein FQN54_003395 [Arachnomyces sp. PD_36]